MSHHVTALVIPSKVLRDQPWETPVFGRVGHHLSCSDTALPRLIPLSGAWAGSGPTPDRGGRASQQKHTPEMLVLTVTDQHATKADEEGLDAGAQTSVLPALPGDGMGYPWVTPAHPREL